MSINLLHLIWTAKNSKTLSQLPIIFVLQHQGLTTTRAQRAETSEMGLNLNLKTETTLELRLEIEQKTETVGCSTKV